MEGGAHEEESFALKARLARARLLLQLMRCFEHIEAKNFECGPGPGAICLQGMDNAHLSYISMFLQPNAFDEFECDNYIRLGIDFVSLINILHCAGENDSITIQFLQGSDRINFSLKDPSNQSFRSAFFGLKLLDIDHEYVDPPDPDLSVIFKISSSELKRICKKFKLLGDRLRISATEDGVIFEARSEKECGKAICRCSEIEIKDKSFTSLEVSLRFMNRFTKATCLNPTVLMTFGKDIPLSLEYEIFSLGEGDRVPVGKFRCWLAPFIEEENLDNTQPS